MDILKKQNKGKTANEILLELFKKEFKDQIYTTISSTTLRYRYNKAVKEQFYIPIFLKNNDLYSKKSTFLEREIQSGIQIFQNDNEYIDKIFSQELDRSLSLNQSQQKNNIDSNNSTHQEHIKTNISGYCHELNDFLKSIGSGRIIEFKFNELMDKFKLKECKVSEDNLSLISCIRLYLKIFNDQECKLEQIYGTFKFVRKEVIEECLQIQYTNYIESLEALFFKEQLNEALYKFLHLIPNVLNFNLYVIEKITDEYIKIDFYGLEKLNAYIVLKQELDSNLSKTVYSLMVPNDLYEIHINISSPNSAKHKIIQTKTEDENTSESNVTCKKRKRRPLTYEKQLDRKKKYGKVIVQNDNFQKSDTNSIMSFQNILNDESLQIPGTYTNKNTKENQQDWNFTNKPETYHIAYINRDDTIDLITLHSVGLLGGEDQILMCGHCKALHYADEVIKSGKFTMCCMDGKIKIPIPPEYPPELKELLYPDETNPLQVKNSKEFLRNVRPINAELSFAAVSARIDTTIRQNWNYVYKIQGNLYRSIAPVQQDEDQHFNIQGAQYFILDTDDAHYLRVGNNPNLSPSVSFIININ